MWRPARGSSVRDLLLPCDRTRTQRPQKRKDTNSNQPFAGFAFSAAGGADSSDIHGPALYSPDTNVARAAADSPRTQLTTFMARYRPDIVKLARSALVTMRRRLPGTVEMVYDNYNALVIGFSPNERPSDA